MLRKIAKALGIGIPRREINASRPVTAPSIAVPPAPVDDASAASPQLSATDGNSFDGNTSTASSENAVNVPSVNEPSNEVETEVDTDTGVADEAIAEKCPDEVETDSEVSTEDEQADAAEEAASENSTVTPEPSSSANIPLPPIGSTNVHDEAIRLAVAGVSVIQIKAGTKVAVSTWKVGQTQRATPTQVARWSSPQAFAVVGGAISGGMDDQGNTLYTASMDFDVPGYKERFEEKAGDLALRLAVQRTGSGNHQMLFRSPLPIRNEKLAWSPNENEETRREVAIETRGIGGYFLLAPSLHPSGERYQMERGDVADLPVLSAEEAQRFLDIAKSLDDAPRTRQQIEGDQKRATKKSYDGSRGKVAQEVIKAYNVAHPIRKMLERYGYTAVGERYARPGGENASVHITDDGYSFHHNSSDPLSDGHRHGAFDVVCYYEYKDDFKAALHAAAEELGMDLQSGESAENAAKREAKFAELLADAQRRGVPQIQVNGRGLYPVLRDIASSVETFNAITPAPRLYFGAEGLMRLTRDSKDRFLLQAYDIDAFVGEASEMAQWILLDRGGNPGEIYPEKTSCSVFLKSSKFWADIPRINAVASTPFFDEEGNLCKETGYYERARTYLQLDKGFQLPDITPTPENVAASKELLLKKLLGHIDFVGKASTAYALALMLQPLIRRLIEGATPLYLYDAPGQSSGKSYAARVSISVHSTPVAMNDAKSDEEWEKMLFTTFVEGRSSIFIDNITSPLSSPALASYITEPYKTQRFLGKNQSGTVFTWNANWIGTSNNARLSPDAASRTVKIRIDANMENPSERVYENDPERYIQEHRGEVVGALLTLVNHWIAQGRPHYTGKPHRFKEWTRIMGGILEVNGIPGFLENLDEEREEMSADREAIRAFVIEWYRTHKCQAQPAKRLLDVASRSEGMTALIGDDEKASKRLGELLFDKRDTVYNVEINGQLLTLKIKKVAGKRTSNGALWHLQLLDPPAPDAKGGGEGPMDSGGNSGAANPSVPETASNNHSSPNADNPSHDLQVVGGGRGLTLTGDKGGEALTDVQRLPTESIGGSEVVSGTQKDAINDESGYESTVGAKAAQNGLESHDGGVFELVPAQVPASQVEREMSDEEYDESCRAWERYWDSDRSDGTPAPPPPTRR